MDDISQTIINAIEGGQWSILAGAVLLVLVSVARKMTADLISPASEWVSAVAAMLAAVAVLLIADVTWWHALVLGLLTPAASDGFWRLVSAAIARYRR